MALWTPMTFCDPYDFLDIWEQPFYDYETFYLAIRGGPYMTPPFPPFSPQKIIKKTIHNTNKIFNMRLKKKNQPINFLILKPTTILKIMEEKK